jgi:hypothetical protein
MEEKIRKDFEEMVEQTKFLAEQQAISKEYCGEQFVQLIDFINKKIVKKGDDPEVKRYQEIANMIDLHYQSFLNEVEEDINFLKKQLVAAEAVESCPDSEKKKELLKLFLDGEDLLDTEQFKQEILQEAQEAKKTFKVVIDDLKLAIDEGNLDEVLVYLQEMEEGREKEKEEIEGEEGIDLFDWVARDNDLEGCDGKCSSCDEGSCSADDDGEKEDLDK